MSWFSCSASQSWTLVSQRAERNIRDAYVYLSPVHFLVLSPSVSSPSQQNQNHGRGRSASTLRSSCRRRRRRPCACALDHQSLRSKAWRRLCTVRHLSPVSSFETMLSCHVYVLLFCRWSITMPVEEKLYIMHFCLVATHPREKNFDLRKFRWLQPVLPRTRIPL